MVNYLINVIVDTSQLEGKFKHLRLTLPGVMKSIVEESIELIHTNSMNLLNQDITFGHSADKDQRIENSKVIKFLEQTPYRIRAELRYESPHAFLTEVGGLVAKTIEKETGAFPIGLQQGNIVAFSPHFELVQGKFFLTRGVQQSLDGVYSIAQNKINQLIANL